MTSSQAAQTAVRDWYFRCVCHSSLYVAALLRELTEKHTHLWAKFENILRAEALSLTFVSDYEIDWIVCARSLSWSRTLL